MTTAGSADIHFYYSTDSIFDSGDIYLGMIPTPIQSDTSYSVLPFTYNKPSFSSGLYYIVYRIDTLNLINEMREYNNEGFIRVFQSPALAAPYLNDFELQTDHWHTRKIYGENLWELGSPSGTLLDSVFSGTTAYTSQLCTAIDTNSFTQLYTPVFDIGTLSNPVVAFKLDYDLSSLGNRNDIIPALSMEYSVDGGKSWIHLDTNHTHTYSFSNWYYWTDRDLTEWQGNPSFNALELDLGADSLQRLFIDRAYYTFKRSNKRYALSSMALDTFRIYPYIQFRFNLATTFEIGGEGVILDDFYFGEGKPDLVVLESPELMESPSARDIHILARIRNEGNYISKNGRIQFYLSTDSLLSSGDYAAGSSTVYRILPGKFYDYPFRLETAPNDSAGNYSWIIGVLDANNLNDEFNENNNVFAYRLNTNQIFNSFPYLSDFTRYPSDGWKWYHDSTGFRNLKVFDDAYQAWAFWSHPNSGIFSSRYNNLDDYDDFPRLFIESPSFDFSQSDSVNLSFQLRCTGMPVGNNTSGGCLQYSLNGGQTWLTMPYYSGTSQNWYNSTQLFHIDNDPGWGLFNQTNSFAHVTLGTGMFAGQSDVKFRFKYRSNYIWSTIEYQGFSLDSFMVSGYSVNYQANDNMLPLNSQLLAGSTSVPVTVTNNSQGPGRTCKLNFYWSADNVLDASDPLAYTAVMSPVGAQQTLTSVVNVPHYNPVTQLTYYLFCKVDASDTLNETSENDNLNSYILNFDQTIGIPESTADNDRISVTHEQITLYVSTAFQQPVTAFLYDMLGNELMVLEIDCKGSTQATFQIPPGLSAGVYQVYYFYGEKSKSGKVPFVSN
jgi:hypothetical protein